MGEKKHIDDYPNIVLINCDDLGYGDLGCYGSEINETPVIDRLAEEGMRFTDFYMAAPVCTPSRGAMLTGCYPRRIGFGTFEDEWVLFPGQPVGLSQNEITIADLLKKQGYSTKIIGKWHCGDQPEFLPTRHGFDSYYGLPYSNDMGIMEFRPDYPPLPLIRDEEVIQEQPDQASLTERYVEEAVKFIRDNKDQRFFLYFAHMYVHLPLYAPQRFLDEADNGAYGAAVECIDWSTGLLLYELRKLGLEDDTLVIFTSDNGSEPRPGGSNSPLRGHKGTTWEGGLRVPCIMKWAGVIPKGKVCSEITTSMDFLPTLANITDSKIPDDRIIDGKDISSLFKQESGAESPYDAFFYYLKDDLEAVRSGDWKLHLKSGELYHLRRDIGETNDVADEYPQVVEELSAKADQCRQDIGDAVTDKTGENCRPIGRVDNAEPLTSYDPEHPYMISLYD